MEAAQNAYSIKAEGLLFHFIAAADNGRPSLEGAKAIGPYVFYNKRMKGTVLRVVRKA